MKDFMNVVRALADENRVRAFLALHERELCVCQLMELLQLAASTASKHLSILKQAGLVECRRDGRWTYYRQSERSRSPLIRSALTWVHANLVGTSDARRVEKNVRRILKMNLEELCCRAAEPQRGHEKSKEPQMEGVTS